MKHMPQYLSPVSIIPGGIPQFLDFALPLEAVARLRRYFREEQRPADDANGLYSHFLRCMEPEGDGFVDQLSGQTGEYDYDMDARKALDVWQGHWLPVPFLRTRDQKWPDGRDRFEYGPSNWARCRVARQQDADGAETLRLVFVFDTQVEEPPGEGEHYHALAQRDLAAHATFKLAAHVRDNSWFLNAPWVDQWLGGVYSAYRQSRHKGRGSWTEDSPYVLEHLASYLTLLDIVGQALRDLAVQVINPDRDLPVEVDLILDIGNSRTTGILVETLPQRITSLNDSYLLHIRDLSQPEHIYTDPFETRVEFAEASFGNDALSRRSGRRTPAFAWPSAVRIGPEASRIATQAVCAEGATGMSSPKRYLWDEHPWNQSWRYNTGGKSEPMVTRGLFAKQVNAQGTPLCVFDEPTFKRNAKLRKQAREPAFESLFSRSSLMLFMVGEIVTQALVTVNSPSQRIRRELPNLPRRLRRVIFTVPIAMPMAEQRIYRRWVNWAVRVVWEALGWDRHYLPSTAVRPSRPDYRLSPQVRCDWDEASCTQLVHLYSELSVKYHGDAHHFFRLLGKERDGKPSLRAASIDIGGGTTDLSITTFHLVSAPADTARISPQLEFRDGFNIAGDEVLREVISKLVLQSLHDELARHGVRDPRTLLHQLFGKGAIGSSQEERNLRSRFIRQVAAPVALAMLTACELREHGTQGANLTCSFADFFECGPEEQRDAQPAIERRAPRPQENVVRYLEDAVRRVAPDSRFTLMGTPIQIAPAAISRNIRATLDPVLADLCEIVHLYDCDILLLSGRPSAWGAVVQSVLAKLPVPPDRVVPMREYHAGGWYPFADAMGRITDPKTSVVVGAILCALAEGHLEGFSYDTGSLRLNSTARFIGELDTNGQLQRPKIWFEVDVNAADSVDMELPRPIQFSTPLPVGYRQLDAERWPTTRYYLLNFASEAARSKAAGKTPYAVNLRLSLAEMRDDGVGERDEGEFEIVDITNRNGESVPKSDLAMHLQTLPLDEGYWLDTGTVYQD